MTANRNRISDLAKKLENCNQNADQYSVKSVLLDSEQNLLSVFESNKHPPLTIINGDFMIRKYNNKIIAYIVGGGDINYQSIRLSKSVRSWLES